MVYICLICYQYTCKYPCECQQPDAITEIHTITDARKKPLWQKIIKWFRRYL